MNVTTGVLWGGQRFGRSSYIDGLAALLGHLHLQVSIDARDRHDHCLLTGVGLIVFGYMAERHFYYYATAIFHGMNLFGICCAAISTSAYAIDAYRDMSSGIFIAGMVFKNFVSYGSSCFVIDWKTTAGPATVFYVFGGVSFAMLGTAPFFFFWGKRYRSYWHRHNLLEKLNIKTHAEL